MAFVYVLGSARANHHPKPRMKPLPFAETCTYQLVVPSQCIVYLTRSRTIRPSNRATITLRTVLRTRKNVCSTSMNASLPVLLVVVS